MPTTCLRVCLHAGESWKIRFYDLATEADDNVQVSDLEGERRKLLFVEQVRLSTLACLQVFVHI